MDIDKGFDKTAGIDLDFRDEEQGKEFGSYKVRFEPVHDNARGDPSKAYPNYKLHVCKLLTVAFIIVAGLTTLAVVLSIASKDSEPELVQDDNSTMNMTTTTSLTTMEQTTITTTSSSTEDTTTTVSATTIR